MSAAVKILIVDDSKMTRSLLNVILRSDEFMIVGEADNAQTGLELAKQLQPDIILLDNVMPEANGITIIKPLKAALPKSIVLMVTSTDDTDLVTEAIQSGAGGFVIKPFNTESVLGTMRKAKESFVLCGPAGIKK